MNVQWTQVMASEIKRLHKLWISGKATPEQVQAFERLNCAFNYMQDRRQRGKHYTSIYQLPVFESCWKGDARDLQQ